MAEEIRCGNCHKLLAKIESSQLRILNGNQATTVYGQAQVDIDCPRCGKTRQVPVHSIEKEEQNGV